ncbi:MAG: MFS transporter, partial [Actinomycetota bacterium]|nr:MFS transporter [Actinomycetota bacterium]
MPRLSNPFALLPREVAVLAAVAFAVAVGYGIVAPAIPVFASSFGVGETAAGAVISAFAFMRFVSALAGGRMVERFGERVILSSGILIVAVSTGLSGFAQSY